MDLTRSNDYPLRRREVVRQILQDRNDMLIIAGLGAPAWDVTAVEDSPLNFPLWGTMGGAVSIALGLALAQPEKRVLVFTGDGEMLMGIGSLATVALQQPANLAIVVLDNERYGETGMQPTHTAGKTDLAAIAEASGISLSRVVHDDQDLNAVIPQIHSAPGPLFFNIKICAENLLLVLPPKEGAYLKDRFRLALLGPKGGVP